MFFYTNTVHSVHLRENKNSREMLAYLSTYPTALPSRHLHAS